jgi:hypothetical protein
MKKGVMGNNRSNANMSYQEAGYGIYLLYK